MDLTVPHWSKQCNFSHSCLPSLPPVCVWTYVLFLTKLHWEADLLLCVVLHVIHVARWSHLGPLKQATPSWEGWNYAPIVLTKAHRYADKDTHSKTRTRSLMLHTLTSLSQSACMCEGLYLGLGTESKYFALSVFHCSSDQKFRRPLAYTHTHTRTQTTPPQWHQGHSCKIIEDNYVFIAPTHTQYI